MGTGLIINAVHSWNCNLAIVPNSWLIHGGMCAKAFLKVIVVIAQYINMYVKGELINIFIINMYVLLSSTQVTG